LLNTSWFLPQNRERIYLVGYSTTPKRGWRGVFPIGEDSGAFNELHRQNSKTLTCRYTADSNGSFIGERELFAEVKQIGTRLDSNSGTQPFQQDRVYDADGIVPALNQGKSDLIVAMRGRYNEDGSTSQRLELNTSGKSNTLTAVQKDNMVVQSNYTYEAANELVRRNTLTEGEVKGLDFYNQSVRDVIPTLTDPKHNSQGLFDGYRIRRLTPIECERLQGFQDDHTSFGNYDGETKPMSNTQRYKQCGNAVTVNVVEAVAKKCIPLFK
jgi:DNA (cytosine-5)-methyltransferase 1